MSDWEIPSFMKKTNIQKENNMQQNQKQSLSDQNNQISSDNGPASTEIMLRSKQGIILTESLAKDINAPPTKCIAQENEFAVFTKSGDHLIFGCNNNLSIYSFDNRVVSIKIKTQNLLNIHISPLGTFLVILQKIDKQEFLLSVLSVPTLTLLKEFKLAQYNRDAWPFIKFDPSDQFCFRLSNNSMIEVWSTQSNPFIIINTIIVDKIDQFYVSPCAQNLKIVCTQVEHFIGFNKTQAKIIIFDIKRSTSEPIFISDVDKAQEITPSFSPDGSIMILTTQTNHDETGQSYYGEANLFYFDFTKQKFMTKIPTHSGPIHDVKWNPNSQEFIVINGFMPATIVVFDRNCQPYFDFGKHHRNTVIWSPDCQFICLGGFGNLNGDVDVWDVKRFKKIGFFKSRSAVSCEFSPDSRHIMTAVLNPRLRVDNNFQIFKYNGERLNFFDMSSTELYDAKWRPQGHSKFNARPASAEYTKTKEEEEATSETQDNKPKKFFRAHGTGQLAAMLKAEKNAASQAVKITPEEYQKKIQANQNISVATQDQKQDQQKYPPGYSAPEQKQKKNRVRKKKQKDKTIENTNNQ